MDDLNPLFDAIKTIPWNVLTASFVPLLIGYGVSLVLGALSRGKYLGRLTYPVHIEKDPGWVRRWLVRTGVAEPVWQKAGEVVTGALFFGFVFYSLRQLPLPWVDLCSFVGAAVATLNLRFYAKSLQDSVVFFRKGIRFNAVFVAYEDLSIDREGDAVVFSFHKFRVKISLYRFNKILHLVADPVLKVRYEALKTQPAATPGGAS